MQLRPIKQRFNWPSREVTLEDLHPQHQQSCTTYDQKEVQDDVIEVNLEAEAEPRPTYVSKNLSSEMAEAIVNLLCKNTKTTLLGSIKKCLARNLVEYQLPIKQGFKPYKQPPSIGRCLLRSQQR